MAKPRLVTATAAEYLHLLSPWVQPYYSDWFDIEEYDPEHCYDPKTDIRFISYVDELEHRPHPLPAAEFRTLVEHLGDSDVDTPSTAQYDRLLLRCPNWMWYNACLEWSWYGLDQYQPNRAYQYSFLMPMNLPRWHRDLAIRELRDLLPTALYSYASRGRELPGQPPPTIPWRGWLNPVWYDTTPFSVVVESYMRSRYNVANPNNYRTEVSEKIFKPMLGQQPFIVYGSVDTVKYLQREGFVTYNNLWDESYDTQVEDRLRFDLVTHTVRQAVQDYDSSTFQLDPESTERIRHNHARLFDRELVIKRFQAEVVGDIVGWWHQ